VSELMNRDLPHQPGGAAARVRSVAELLRIYAMLVDRHS